MTRLKLAGRAGHVGRGACWGALVVLGSLLVALAAHAEGEAPDVSAKPPAGSQSEAERWGKMTSEEALEVVMVPLQERLSLTSEQVTKVRPIATDYLKAVGSLREQYKAEEIGMMSLMWSMQTAGQTMSDRILPLLDTKQAEEYEALKTEQRTKMMEGLANRISGG